MSRASLIASTIAKIYQNNTGAITGQVHQDADVDIINQTWDQIEAQPPLAHASTHFNGGTDPIKLDQLALPSDTTTLDATSARHGLLKKLINDNTKFLNSSGNWAIPSGTGGGVSNFDQLGDVPQSYTGAAGQGLHVNRAETGLVFGSPSLPTLDIGLLFNIVGKSNGNMNTPDFCGVSCPGYPSGMSITDFATEFPNYYYVLHTDLGWSNSDCLGLTYFTAAWNELGFFTYAEGTGFPFHRFSLGIPAGKHWYNSELRWGQSIIQGAGPFHYYGHGATELCLTHTNWKSIYGSQNDGTYVGIVPWVYAGEQGLSVYPLQTGGGYEYAHAFTVKDLCMTGSDTLFNDPTIREVGFYYWSPGENSGADNCLFTGYNDFGVLSTGACAYGNLRNCSFFSNKVGGQGIMGISRSTFQTCHSGDFNPWAIYTFRSGETYTSPNKYASKTTTTASFTQPAVNSTVSVTVTSPARYKVGYQAFVKPGGYYLVMGIAGSVLTLKNINNGSAFTGTPGATIASGSVVYPPYWPNFIGGNPGANINVFPFKLEAFACNSAFGSYSACNPNVPGKGQMMARLTGRFHFSVMGGGTATVHQGKVDSLIQVVDDYVIGQGGIPLSNSSIEVRNLGTVSFAHWLHVLTSNKKWVDNVVDDDSQGTGIMWTANYASGQAYDPLRVGATMTSITSNYQGRLPFINDADPHTWDQANPPTWGYDEVTGLAYPQS